MASRRSRPGGSPTAGRPPPGKPPHSGSEAYSDATAASPFQQTARILRLFCPQHVAGITNGVDQAGGERLVHLLPQPGDMHGRLRWSAGRNGSPQTPSSSMVRVTTWPAWRIRYLQQAEFARLQIDFLAGPLDLPAIANRVPDLRRQAWSPGPRPCRGGSTPRPEREVRRRRTAWSDSRRRRLEAFDAVIDLRHGGQDQHRDGVFLAAQGFQDFQPIDPSGAASGRELPHRRSRWPP